MDRFSKVLWCALLAVCWVLPVGQARAEDAPPDPDQAVARCLQDLQKMTEECVQRNRQTAENCVRLITELKEAGRDEAARRVARRCIARVNHFTEHCAQRIRRRCHRCVHILEQLGAPQAAEVVKQACEAALMAIRTSQRAAIEAIRNALGGGEEPGGEAA